MANLTPTTNPLSEVVAADPALRAQAVASIDAQIERYTAARAELTGEDQPAAPAAKPAKAKAASTGKKRSRLPAGTHHKLAIKCLFALKASKADAAIGSKEIKALSKNKFKHDMDAVLNVTLNDLSDKMGIVGYRDISKGEKPRYLWYCKAASESDAIAKYDEFKAKEKAAKGK